MIIPQLRNSFQKNKLHEEAEIPAFYARFADRAALIEGQKTFKARVIDCTIDEDAKDKAVCPYCGSSLNYFGYHYKAFRDVLEDCIRVPCQEHNIYYLKCNRMQCTNHACTGKTRPRKVKAEDKADATADVKADKDKVEFENRTQTHRPTHLVLSHLSFPFTAWSLDTVDALIILKDDNDQKALHAHIRQCLQLERSEDNDEKIKHIILFLKGLIQESTAKLIFKVYDSISLMLEAGLCLKKEQAKLPKQGWIKESSDFSPQNANEFLKKHTSATSRLHALFTTHFSNVSTHLLWLDGLSDKKMNSS